MKRKIMALLLGWSITTSAFGFMPWYELVITAAGQFTLGVLTGMQINQSNKKKKDQYEKDVAMFMKKNHASLVRDIALGRGPMILEWGANMHMNSSEQAKFENRIEGSMEQMEMLTSLSGTIEIKDAAIFSRALVRVLVDVVGKDHMRDTIVLKEKK